MQYQLYDYNDMLGFAQDAGFTGNSANIAAAIGMAESGGDPYAVNSSDPNGGSYGLTQINGIWPGAQNTLGDPGAAFSQMFNISQGGTNFNPWGSFTNNSYQAFLPGNSSDVPTNADGTPCGPIAIFFGCGTPQQVGNYNQNQTNTPGTIENKLTGTGQDLGNTGVMQSLKSFFSFITSGQGWERIAVIIIGLMLLLVAGFMLATRGFEGTIRAVKQAA